MDITAGAGTLKLTHFGIVNGLSDPRKTEEISSSRTGSGANRTGSSVTLEKS